MSDFQRAYVNQCIDILQESLRPLCAEAKRRKNQHWVKGNDESLSYCEDCIDTAVAAAKSACPGISDSIVRDGGWPTENDSPQYCEVCSAPLSGHLTGFGAQMVFDHFIERMQALGHLTELSPDEAYALDDALTAVRGCDEGFVGFEELCQILKLSLNLQHNLVT